MQQKWASNRLVIIKLKIEHIHKSVLIVVHFSLHRKNLWKKGRKKWKRKEFLFIKFYMPRWKICTGGKKSIFCIFFGALFFSLSMLRTQSKKEKIGVFILYTLTHVYNDKRQHLHTFIIFFFLGNPQHKKYVSLLLLILLILLADDSADWLLMRSNVAA